MLLPDVNILVYAYRDAAPNHEHFKAWVQELVNGEEAYGVSDLVCSSFLRIVTNPRIFAPPSTLDDALLFLDQIRTGEACVILSPGPRHWQIFTDLCRRSAARGNLIPDAYFAALAIESGSEWISTDGDFARFPGLRWRRPF